MIEDLKKYGLSWFRYVLFITLLLTLCALLIIFYLLYKQNQPVEYYITENGENFLIMPSSTPILQVNRVKEWSTAVVSQVFSFNFVDVDKHVERMKKFFSDAGWANFQDQLKRTNLLKDVKSKNLIFNASVCDMPVLSNRMQDPKAFYLSSKWKFIIPIVINIVGASNVEMNLVYIMDTEVRFLTDNEISERHNTSGATSILGIDAITMRSASLTNYCKI